ncbi:TadE/TadG family type IV pilus assembly protein [Occallatibacter savannae]|uniref:TadE/TadG family type IV pilus assembly protein n=1 Tax=Occallatibacter savannae TaxID=1002691 RepID=UPI0013A5599B|nr:pilus assembly protein TadG-related protein [Occallatibacter savannae]
MRILNRQDGQILAWFSVLLILFGGFTAFVIDAGRGIIAYHMLQQSCDAAAMAGVQLMSDATQSSTAVTNQATLYSSVPGKVNANPSFLPNASMLSGYPKVYCSTTGQNNGVPCVAAGGTANAITVAQTVTIPTYFGGLIGIPRLTMSAASSALMAGAAAQKYNIAIVLDTTASMNSADPGGCTGSGVSNPTKIQCALLGVQTLLKGLQPCTSTSTSGSCTGFDGVSIFTYPNIPANKASQFTTCNSSAPTPVPYTAPTPGAAWTNPAWTSTTPSYQITSGGTNGYMSDWSSNNQTVGSSGSYNNSSTLAIAAGAASGCKGMQAKGGEGTYLAGAIYAAGASLAAQGQAVANSKNAMIILSDGDATSSAAQFDSSVKLTSTGVYPSATDECHQSITAANWVSNNVPNTTVFTVAYNAGTSGTCATDTPAITACSEMQQMATAPSDFYADSSSSCPGTKLSLPAIFGSIQSRLTTARLLPVGS